MPSGTAAASRSANSGDLWSPAASNPNSSGSAAHFSGPPAMPTARAPLIRAICPTAEPTGPVAAATMTVSPGCGRPISSSPAYAVNPGMPRTPSAVEIGANEGSSFRSPRPSLSAYDCQPEYDSTTSPTAYSGFRDSTTSQTVPPTSRSPTSTGSAYDSASLIRPRMYGSSERYTTRSNSCPSTGSGTSSSTN